MFKKIRSDRNPKDTILSELQREFSPHFNGAKSKFKTVAKSYPKFLFFMMVINIAMSVILCFTVMRHKELPKTKAPSISAPVTNGLDSIIKAGAELKQTITLKRQVDSLSKIKKLSSADSAILLKDLDSLNHIKP